MEDINVWRWVEVTTWTNQIIPEEPVEEPEPSQILDEELELNELEDEGEEFDEQDGVGEEPVEEDSGSVESQSDSPSGSEESFTPQEDEDPYAIMAPPPKGKKT